MKTKKNGTYIRKHGHIKSLNTINSRDACKWFFPNPIFHSTSATDARTQCSEKRPYPPGYLNGHDSHHTGPLYGRSVTRDYYIWRVGHLMVLWTEILQWPIDDIRNTIVAKQIKVWRCPLSHTLHLIKETSSPCQPFNLIPGLTESRQISKIRDLQLEL